MPSRLREGNVRVAALSATTGGTPIRGFLFYLVLLPGVVMIVLALLRFGFAVRFWRRLYIVGLVYVAVLLIRLALQVIG